MVLGQSHIPTVNIVLPVEIIFRNKSVNLTFNPCRSLIRVREHFHALFISMDWRLFCNRHNGNALLILHRAFQSLDNMRFNILLITPQSQSMMGQNLHRSALRMAIRALDA